MSSRSAFSKNAIVIVVLCLLPTLAFAAEGSVTQFDRLLLLFGKLHPVAVHFPVALLFCAAILELWYLAHRERRPQPLTRFCLGVGAASAIIAAIFGWLNAAHQEFFGSLEEVLFLHRWAGIAVTILAVLSFIFCTILMRREPKRLALVYRGTVFLNALLIIASSHYGGKMVHGEDYYAEIFDVLDSSPEKDGALAKARMDPKLLRVRLEEFPAAQREVSFEDEIKPIFQKSCAKCHLNGKEKGELRLDSRKLILKGGETGPALVPGHSDQSLLIELITELDPDRVMPNKGRKLNPDEIGLLRAWIEQGAKWEGDEEISAFSKVPYLPREVELPDLDEGLGLAHPIDRLLSVYFSEKSISVGDVVDDHTFARRVYLDLNGLLPTPSELKAFLADQSPQKRRNLIDTLLSRRDDYTIHWMAFWNDLLRNGYTGPGFLHGKRKEVTEWLYAALYDNMPFDQFVRELVNPSDGARGFVRGILWWTTAEEVNPVEDPAVQAAQNIGQVFMGANIKCASCHNSFTDAWTLKDTFGLANVFAKEPLEIHSCNQPTGEFETARFLIPEVGRLHSPTTKNLEQELAEIEARHPKNRMTRERKKALLLRKARRERMARLAQVMTDTKNGRLARTFVNRIWAKLFGRGIVEPIDEMDQPAWNSDVLDWLAVRFVEDGYDVQKLLRLVMTSRAYQLEAVPALEQFPEDYVFQGPHVRRLTAEQFLDSMRAAADVWPEASNSEVKRVLSILVKNLNEPERKKVAGKSAPQILFVSDVIDLKNPQREVDVDIRGAEQLWLAVISRHRLKTPLEKLAEQHENVRKAEEEARPMLKYIPVQINTQNPVEEDKAIEQMYEDNPENAVWGNPRLLGTDSVISLTEIARKNDTSGIPGSEVVVVRPGDKQRIGFWDREIQRALSVKPTSLLRYDLKGKEFTRFQATVGVDRVLEDPRRGYQFVIIANANLRASHLENTDLMWTLGRPTREQVITQRNSVANTIQALALTNGEEMIGILRSAALNLSQRNWTSSQEFASVLYQHLLGREPTAEELQMSSEFLGEKLAEEKIEDFLWAMLMQPEFQLIL